MNITDTKDTPLCNKDLIEMLEGLLELAKNREINNIIASGFLSDGSVFTSVIGADAIEHHTLVSYLQASAIKRTIKDDTRLDGLH